MLIGPFVTLQMRRAARGWIDYAARAVYAAALLAALLISISGPWRVRPFAPPPTAISAIAAGAQDFFTAFVFLQAFLVLMLTQMILSGSIARERERKTLDDLLSTQLTSAEIILGKLIAAWGEMAMLLLTGFGVFSVARMFGGVEMERLLSMLGGTVAIMLESGGVAVLASVWSRQSKNAMQLVQNGMALLYVGPVLIHVLGMLPWNGSNFFSILDSYTWQIGPMAWWRWFSNHSTMADNLILWGFHAAVGIACVGLAIWSLRPAYHYLQLVEAARGARLQRKASRTRRRALGRWPVFWKETNTRIPQWFRYASFLTALVAYFGFIVIARTIYGMETDQIAFATTFITTALLCIATLVAMARASGMITSEKTADTWLPLLTTPLTAKEIVVGKMAGAAYEARELALLSPALWLACATLDVRVLVNPIAQLLVLAPILAFFTSMGIYSSIHTRPGDPYKRMPLRPTLLMVLLLVCGSLQAGPPLLGLSGSAHRIFNGGEEGVFIAVGMVLAGAALYGLVATFMVRHCVRNFDRWAGRTGRHALKGRAVEPAPQN